MPHHQVKRRFAQGHSTSQHKHRRVSSRDVTYHRTQCTTNGHQNECEENAKNSEKQYDDKKTDEEREGEKGEEKVTGEGQGEGETKGEGEKEKTQQEDSNTALIENDERSGSGNERLGSDVKSPEYTLHAELNRACQVFYEQLNESHKIINSIAYNQHLSLHSQANVNLCLPVADYPVCVRKVCFYLSTIFFCQQLGSDRKTLCQFCNTVMQYLVLTKSVPTDVNEIINLSTNERNITTDPTTYCAEHDIPAMKGITRKSISHDRQIVDTCTICSDDIQHGVLIDTLDRCGHVFHSECNVTTWLLNSSNAIRSCPNCRAIVE